MKKILFLGTTLAILVTSCSTDFEVNAPWQDKTVIFGMLDQSDTAQYIKINKAFLGEDDAYNMAAVSDSFNYENLNVTLNRYNVDEELVQTIPLYPSNDVIKDTGIFADDNNILYKTTSRIRRNAHYKLVVEVPGTGKVVTADTYTIDTFKIERPLYIQSGPEIAINFAQTSPLVIYWYPATNAKICYVTIYFNYYDIEGTDTTLQQIEYSLSPNIYTRTDYDGLNTGTPKEVKEINGEEFYKFVSSAIDAPSDGVKRLAKSLDFQFYLGTEDYYTYYQVNNSSSGLSQSNPLFTNVENGIGLFSSKYKQAVYNKHLNAESLDSLSRGRFTKHLRFADSNNIWP